MNHDAATFFRALLQAAPDAMVVVAADGHIELANRHAEAMFGYAQGALDGQAIEDLVPQPFRSGHAGHVRTFEQAPFVRSMGTGDQLTGLRRDGTEFPVEISLSPLGGSTMAAIRDLTERARADERFRRLLEHAPDAVVVVDGAGRIVLVNSETERLFGYEREALIGRDVEVLLPEPLRRMHVQHRGRFAAEPKVRPMSTSNELRGRRRDGTEFPVEISLAPLEGLEGPLVTATVRDVSERRAAERSLAKYAAELERSNDDLERFAHVAAHDLQEPLRKINMLAERLGLRSGEALSDADRADLQRIRSAASRMSALVKDLLAYSSVGLADEVLRPVDLGVVMDLVLSDLEGRIEETKATLHVGALPAIDGEPTQLRQLLQNLIGNALKYHRPGVPPVVRVMASSRLDDHDVELCDLVVADQGIGFEQVHAERIFQPFERLHGRSEFDGTGIGLAICARIAAFHGGNIRARSAPGQGAVFVVSLPVRARAPQ